MITRWCVVEAQERLYLYLSHDGVHVESEYLLDEVPGIWMPCAAF